MSEKKLVKKLAKVMQHVKYIEKKGYNKFHKYNYATESDVAEKVREVLAEESVMMLPDVIEHTTREHTTRNGTKEYIATVKVKFTFIDGETGEELSIHSVGEGQDAGDKAVYKAITGAQKYALMKAFMIPTGDDPEADDGVDKRNQGNQEPQRRPQEPITAEQVGLIKIKADQFAKSQGKTIDDVYAVLKITELEKLNKTQADAVLKQLNIWLEKVKQGASA